MSETPFDQHSGPTSEQVAELPTDSSEESLDPRIDRAAAIVGNLDDVPLDEHGEAFDDVHTLLHDALADTAGD